MLWDVPPRKCENKHLIEDLVQTGVSDVRNVASFQSNNRSKAAGRLHTCLLPTQLFTTAFRVRNVDEQNMQQAAHRDNARWAAFLCLKPLKPLYCAWWASLLPRLSPVRVFVEVRSKRPDGGHRLAETRAPAGRGKKAVPAAPCRFEPASSHPRQPSAAWLRHLNRLEKTA